MSFPNDPEPWRVIQSHYLHRRPWLTMRRDSVRLPNGRVIDDFYVWEHDPWVNVIAVTTSGEVVLIRQYRHGLGQVSFELPAGVHDRPGETLLDAARRELLEETGYGGGEWKAWMTLSPNPSLQNNLSHTFLATGVEKKGAQRLDATEEITIHLVSPERLGEIIDAGDIVQALHAAPIIRYLCSSVPESREGGEA